MEDSKAGKGIVAMITNHAWLDNPSLEDAPKHDEYFR